MSDVSRIAKRILSNDAGDPPFAGRAIPEPDAGRPPATPELLAEAREMYADDDIQIDNDALTSVADDATWVQAWVRVPH